MAYTIDLKLAAARDLRNRPGDVRHRLAVRIDALAIEPTPPGVEPLKGEPDLFRLRAGDYRMLYQLDRKARIVLVARIGHRREVYRRR